MICCEEVQELARTFSEFSKNPKPPTDTPTKTIRGSGGTGTGWGLMKTSLALPKNRRGGTGNPAVNIPSYMMSRRKGWEKK